MDERRSEIVRALPQGDSTLTSPPRPTLPKLSEYLQPDQLCGRQQTPTTRTIEPSATRTETTDEDNGYIGPPIVTLTPASTPIPLAAKMGLIMPNPWNSLYVGVNYSFGFVDPVERPAPTVGGWIRHVQPLLIFPDYTVDIFPGTGPETPDDEGAVPPRSDGLCGTTAEDYAISYPFRFANSGWYMFVINQTWIQPTLASSISSPLCTHRANGKTNNTCMLPLLSQKSFFSFQTLSIAPAPTYAAHPVDPTMSFTVFADVSTQTPSSLPRDRQPATSAQKVALGFGISGAVLLIALIGGVVWWVRKKHKMERESLAFSRLSEQDKASFLAENPEHFLNPGRPSQQRYWNPRNQSQPPAPPGTMAYSQWYMAQMSGRQLPNWQQSGTTTGEWMKDRRGRWNGYVDNVNHTYHGVTMGAGGPGGRGPMVPPKPHMGYAGSRQPALVYNSR